jgi:hypothetical protein
MNYNLDVHNKSVHQQAYLLKMVVVKVQEREGISHQFRFLLNPVGSERALRFDTLEELSTHLQSLEKALA